LILAFLGRIIIRKLKIERFKDAKTAGWIDMQLIREGQVNPETISSEAGERVDKRGRQQGFCFRKTRTGRYLPYICWKKGKNSIHTVAYN